jgi:hypothetical protein
MRRLHILFVCLIVAALAISLASLLLPTPPDAEIAAFYNPLGTVITLFDSAIAVCAAILFLRALRGFNPELKPAYRLLAVSTLLYGIFTLIYPIIEYFGLWGSIEWSIVSYSSFFFGGPLMYLSVRQFYKRLGFGGVVASLPVFLGFALIAWAVYIFTPHAPEVWPTETLHDAMQFITLLPLVSYAAAAYMSLRVLQRTGRDYNKAFGFLLAGLVLQTIAAATVIVLEVIGYENWYFESRSMWIPIITGDLAILLAGYFFNRIGSQTNSKPRKNTASSMEIITYAANMASDVTKVDPLLDKMRTVTAALAPDQPLSATDQRHLSDVYLGVEQYLAHDDPLRRVEPRELRQQIEGQFTVSSTDASTFWPLLK